ncbi:cysteine protease and A protease inhibitor, putative [Ixodes scapularis]|uniref:Cathepsin O n=1 Tax=Ixodes scapularis TaxID=6945 RepID=B7P7I7_IXOSC|nr:cysteine protease and A protease inhibitor, putative [Ixodes scapularis]|eukprot:XP_002399230.1 cysteine protease and A protease inhibitor, putative [Ixodes scapularis]
MLTPRSLAFVAVIQLIPLHHGDGRLHVLRTETDDTNRTADPSVEAAFEQYVKRYNKTYASGSAEYSKRLNAFRDALIRIEDRNRHGNHSNGALYGLTPYSDLTPDEFRALLATFAPAENTRTEANEVEHDDLQLALPGATSPRYPPKFDWRTRGVVTAVRNQRDCGACWAFSTVETVETMHALAAGTLTGFSVQQMIDCSNNSNHGCNGGDTCAALKWLKVNRIKLVRDSVYPFKAVTGSCQHPASDVTAEVSDYTCDRLVGNEERMIDMLANVGPLVVAVDATTWQDYLGGVIQFHCDAGRNHAVQIVGYDLTGDVPYYIVRNSWGKQFGNDGYLYIAVGKNLCGIAEEVSTVRVKNPAGGI